MNSKARVPACCIVVWLLLPSVAAAQTSGIPQSEDASADYPSANYPKAEKLLPGEKVITPTGQKIKVWSTEGPVPVSRAPEPFDEPQQIEEVPVVVERDRRPHATAPRRRPRPTLHKRLQAGADPLLDDSFSDEDFGSEE